MRTCFLAVPFPAPCVCQNYEIYLTKVKNVFVQMKKFQQGGLVRWLHPCPLSPLPVLGTKFSQHSSHWTATAKIDPHTKWSKAKYLQHS